MSGDAQRTRRVRKVAAEDLPTPTRKPAPTPRKHSRRKVRLPTNRHMSEIINVPDAMPDGPKIELVRRRRSEEEMLRACMAEGMQRNQIKRVLGVTDKELGAIEKRLLANDGQLLINQSTAHRFYNYVLQQEQCARDLEYVLAMIIAEIELYNGEYKKFSTGEGITTEDGRPILPPKPSHQAAIMAIKAKSEILDRTIKMGQDLGIIEKRAKELRISGGLNLAAMPTEELRAMMAQKLDEFQSLVGQGKLPTVYQRMLANKREPHERAALRGRDGSNLDPSI